jgi:uncharacterized protein YbaR (Trm112 family)
MKYAHLYLFACANCKVPIPFVVVNDNQTFKLSDLGEDDVVICSACEQSYRPESLQSFYAQSLIWNP